MGNKKTGKVIRLPRLYKKTIKPSEDFLIGMTVLTFKILNIQPPIRLLKRWKYVQEYYT